MVLYTGRPGFLGRDLICLDYVWSVLLRCRGISKGEARLRWMASFFFLSLDMLRYLLQVKASNQEQTIHSFIHLINICLVPRTWPGLESGVELRPENHHKLTPAALGSKKKEWMRTMEKELMVGSNVHKWRVEESVAVIGRESRPGYP